MQRELNPQLFSNRPGPDEVDSALDRRPLPSTLNGEWVASPGLPDIDVSQSSTGYLPEAVRILEAQVQSLRMILQNMDRKVSSLEVLAEESTKTLHGRVDRVGHAVARMDEATSQAVQDINSRMGIMFSKVNERKVSDSKLVELIERHNSVVRNFENRLVHLQRVLSEQEMQMMNTQALLDEARQEIARLRAR